HEFRLPLVSRNPRWISVLAGVVYDATETAVGCVGVLEEITARKRAEGALRSTAREFEDLYNHSLAGHLTFNRNGVITRVNDTQLRWLGYPRGDLVGAKRFSDLLTPASREVLAGQAEKFEQPGGLAGIELELVRSDGSTVPVLAGATVTRDTEGNVVATHCTLCEFSARKQFETELTRERDAALQSARHRSEFLAMVSHEIRTPMNGVIGMTGLLHDTRLTEEQEGYVQTIRSSADTLLTIINDILDFSRIEGGKLELTEEDFDLNDVLDTTLDLLAENARAKKLVLAGYIAAGTPGRLRGDAERLRQILTSLTGNAVKFTDTGEVVVRASSEMETDSHVRLRFEVRDTGVGISPATLEKLFQPFQQTEDLAMRRFGGAGLGLVISRQLVELMRGDLGAESEPGRGSTFWFTVHLEKQPPVFNAAQVPAAPTLQDRHILAVDDNPTGREVIRHQLQSTGSRLDLASSGKEALGMMRAAVERGDAYELAVLDWWMPEMDGLTLASQIKADLALSRTRLVLLTAMGENLAANLLHDRGIEACLHKPVKQTSLIKTLASVLEKKQPVFSAPVAVAGAAPVASRKIRILLAEDHLINQRVAMGLLAKLGYSAEAAANGIEVLEMLKQTAYDVILMDCQMPEMDGLEATRRIRAMEAKRAAGQVVNLASPRRTIIIAVTANAMQGDRERCLSAGMDDYLSKPVRLDTLEKMLQRAQVLAGDTSDAGPPAPPAAVAAPVPVRPAEEPPVAAVPQDDLMAALDQALVEMTPPPAKPAQSPAPDGDQPVDLDRIQELTDGNETGVQELVDLYLAQAAELTDKLRMAVESKSAEDIGHVAHKFCGASLTCGMVAVVASLRAMERLGKAGQVEGTPELMADVARQVDRIRLFWRNYFSGN
ncbi:MAG TPA: response regulator, partial [Verrucomicrobiae bacterium]|nr:response regulator [Verrucomicrobiae bacterium]